MSVTLSQLLSVFSEYRWNFSISRKTVTIYGAINFGAINLLLQKWVWLKVEIHMQKSEIQHRPRNPLNTPKS